MKSNFILVLVLLGFNSIIYTQNEFVLDAEEAELSGMANIAHCTAASGGQLVWVIINGLNNALTFANIEIQAQDFHFITL